MSMITFATLLLALASLQTPGPQAPGPLMWTGEGQVARPAEREAPDYATALRGELEALAARADLQRDYSTQLAKLELLRGFACWSVAYPGKAGLLADIAGMRADWFEKLGRHAEAVAAAWQPLVQPYEKAKPPYDRFVWAAANASIAQLVGEIDALPATVELRRRFPSDAVAAKTGDPIEEVVRRVLSGGNTPGGNTQNLKDLGVRCVPALKRALAEGPEAAPAMFPAAAEPLVTLLELDRAAGNDLLLATLVKRGVEWTLRAIAALQYSGATQSSWLDGSDSFAPKRFDDPRTLQVIDLLASEPMTALSFFQLVEPLVGNDVVSPSLRSFLLAQVRTTDPLILTVLRSMLDGVRIGPNKRPLYEAFLESSDADLRQRCANALGYYPVGPATLRATEHADPNVRRTAARALVRHRAAPYDYEANSLGGNSTRRWYEVPRTPEIEAALLRLARDSEQRVRIGLVGVLQGAGEKPPMAVLDALLADPDPEVRSAAAFNWSFDPALQERVLRTLVDDRDPAVLRAVGVALNALSPARSDSFRTSFPRYFPVLAGWLANPATELGDDPSSGPGKPIRAALMSPEGARLVFEACVHGPRSAELVPMLLGLIEWGDSRPERPSVYETLDSGRVAELFALGCAGNPQAASSMLRDVSRAVRQHRFDPTALLGIARDTARPRDVRLRALSVAASKAGPAEGSVYLELLSSVKAEELAPGSEAGKALLGTCIEAMESWPAAALGGIGAEACKAPRLADVLALRVGAAAAERAQEPLDAATIGICIERWGRLDAASKPTAAPILGLLDPAKDGRVLQLWRQERANLQVAGSVLYGMERFPVDECTDLLREYVVEPDVASNEWIRASAISALTRRLDDRGADALLKAIAGTSNSEVRRKCFEGLEQIRKYQDEKQSWQKRKGGAAARDQAVAQLLPMLDDKDPAIRASAARSLATLAAVEHLPRLVQMLRDKDPAVREAAQKALDVLNTPAEKKP